MIFVEKCQKNAQNCLKIAKNALFTTKNDYFSNKNDHTNMFFHQKLLFKTFSWPGKVFSSLFGFGSLFFDGAQNDEIGARIDFTIMVKYYQ